MRETISLLDEIKTLVREKEKDNKHPTHVLIKELCNRHNCCYLDIKDELNDLYKKGFINVIYTINSIAVCLTKNQKQLKD